MGFLCTENRGMITGIPWIVHEESQEFAGCFRLGE